MEDLALDEDTEQRGVAGQDAQFARDGPGAYELGLALPDLPVGGNHLNLGGLTNPAPSVGR